MIEAMACGTPVLALPGGSVKEVVSDGVSGYVCCSVEELARRAREIETSIRPATVRFYAKEYFSLERMVAEYEHLYSAIRDLGSPRSVRECSDVESTDVNQFRQLCKIIMSTAKHHVVLKLSI